MTDAHSLAGVYAAAVTPLDSDLSPELDQIPRQLRFLADRGCHGALILGTTGEGPSFSVQERLAIFRAAILIRQERSDFKLLAGVGTPNLEETIVLTRAAFELGFDGVVTLPPYYYRKVSDEGLFSWFSHVLQHAVPQEGDFLGYHIPPITGIGFSLDLLSRLKDAFPDRFAGIKDSSGDPEYAQQLGSRFGKNLVVLTGNDRLFSLALSAQGSGCITAPANLFSGNLRQIWDSYQAGTDTSLLQAQVDQQRLILERCGPFPPVIKALLHRLHAFPAWPVRPPLLPASAAVIEQVLQELSLFD